MPYQFITALIILQNLLIIPIIYSERRGKTLIKSSTNVQDLDHEGKVILGWTLNEEEESITFELEGETDGYVGLGISLYGTMSGSDLFVAGVYPNGSSYHSDRFVPFGELVPKIDKFSNWRLLKAEEVTITSATKRGHLEVTKTYLKFTRFLNTCDEKEDLKIGKDPIKFIWALGEKDEVDYHGVDERGTKTIDLFQAEKPQPALDFDDTQVFKLTLINASIPFIEDDEEDYAWCTFYRGPDLDDMHHVVAWSAVLGDSNAHKFVRHMTVYSCSVGWEDSAFEIFENFTNNKFNVTNCSENLIENESEDDDMDVELLPVKYCTEALYSWSRGNMDFYLPDDVGYPIGDQEGLKYYMLKTHLSNPESFSGDINLNAGIHMHYTDELRPMEAGMLWIGREPNFGLVIPPNVYDYVVSAHCSPNCTRRFPPNGITIFNTMFQAQHSGRRIKVRHFRRGLAELPWIDNDEEYNFNYAQSKQLVKPVTAMPGDQIILECTFDTMWKNGTVGSIFSDEELETCQGYFWYYPKMEVALCGSSYPLNETLLDLGITNYHNITGESSSESIQIDEPESLEGEFESVLNTKFNWTLVFRQLLETKTRFELQESVCLTHTQRMENIPPKSNTNPKISYPIWAKNHAYISKQSECTEKRRNSMPGGGGIQNAGKPFEYTIFIAFTSLIKFSNCL